MAVDPSALATSTTLMGRRKEGMAERGKPMGPELNLRTYVCTIKLEQSLVPAMKRIPRGLTHIVEGCRAEILSSALLHRLPLRLWKTGNKEIQMRTSCKKQFVA